MRIKPHECKNLCAATPPHRRRCGGRCGSCVLSMTESHAASMQEALPQPLLRLLLPLCTVANYITFHPKIMRLFFFFPKQGKSNNIWCVQNDIDTTDILWINEGAYFRRLKKYLISDLTIWHFIKTIFNRISHSAVATAFTQHKPLNVFSFD